MSNTLDTEEIKSIPIKWGIIIALVSVALQTVLFTFLLDNMMMFFIMTIVFLVIPIFLFGFGAAAQRKALGGYIDLKQAFRAVFIMVLFTVIITNAYGYVYKEFIDPDFVDKLRASMISFLDNAKMSQENIDNELTKFDKRMAEQSSIKALFMNVLIQIIVYSIFGFIIAAIVKKKRPDAMA